MHDNNKKVSQRKLIARQHFCHKNFGRGWERGPCNFFYLTQFHQHAKFCSCVSYRAQVLKIGGAGSRVTLKRPNARRYHAEFGRSRSNGNPPAKNWAPCVPPFKVTQDHRNRRGSIGCLWLPVSEKIAQLYIPEYVYNWILDFLQGHLHCTFYNGESSGLREVTASISQGSAIGPALCLLLKLRTWKAICYADDTYIPASNSHTRTIELEHIDSWAKLSNLTLNRAKTVEVIFADKKSKRTAILPLPLPGITRCTYWSHNNYQRPVNGWTLFMA